MSFIEDKKLDAKLRKFGLNQSRAAFLILIICLFVTILLSGMMNPVLAVIMGFVYFPLLVGLAFFVCYWFVRFITSLLRGIFSGWNEGFEKQNTVDYYDPDC